jgi:hypothetical protein
MRGKARRQAAYGPTDTGADDTRAARSSTSNDIVPADGTSAANWRERRLRYVPALRAALRQATACLYVLMWGAERKCTIANRKIKRRAPSCRPWLTFHSSYLSCVFSASVSHLSAISMKKDLCAGVRASSASRMHSAAFLPNLSKLGEGVSNFTNLGFRGIRLGHEDLYLFCLNRETKPGLGHSDQVSLAALSSRP